MSGLGSRLRDWRPRTPDLPYDLARLVKPDDPDWFAREMAIAAAPPWWFWTFLLRRLLLAGGPLRPGRGERRDPRGAPARAAAARGQPHR